MPENLCKLILIVFEFVQISVICGKKILKAFALIKIKIGLVYIDKKCIFAPLINRGRVPQNLIIRLCQ